MAGTTGNNLIRGTNMRNGMSILCMGGRTVGPAAWDLVETFLSAEFSQATCGDWAK